MNDAKNSIDVIGEAAKEALKESWKELLIESLPEVQLPLGPVETIALTWEHRSRARRKCITSSGTKIAMALPRGTVLADRMLVYNTAERAIAIKAESEDVLVVKPANAMEMCVLAHHLGNWHRSLQLNDDGSIVVDHDSPLSKWLDLQKISYEREHNAYHPNLKGSAHD